MGQQMDASKEAMLKAIKEKCVPALRKQGFKGSFPNFYRDQNDFVSLVNFQFFSSGGSFCVNLGFADPRRENISFQPHKNITVNKLRVNSTRDQRRLGAQAGDRWFSFGRTNYGELRGETKPVNEITSTCSQLFLDDAEPWWRTKRLNTVINGK
jgi:hypothetical protein